MSTNDESMQSQPPTKGDVMGSRGGAAMDPEQSDLHTLDAEEQHARMGLTEPQTAMGQPPELANQEEAARREEAAKLGDNP